MKTQRLDIVKDLVKEAGEIALRHFGRIVVTRKADSSPVTQADIEVGEFLTRRLKLNFPNYGIVNEESTTNDPDVLHKHEYVWVLDPIDGTASFAHRLPIWGICVGLMKGSEPVMGVVYLPLMGDLYYCDEKTPAIFESSRWGAQEMHVIENVCPFDRESTILTVSYAHRRLNFHFPGKTRSMGSTTAHICYVSRGDAVAAVVKGAIWDIVPGLALLKKSGGTARHLDGSYPELAEMLDGKPSRDFIIMGSEPCIERLVGSVTVKV